MTGLTFRDERPRPVTNADTLSATLIVVDGDPEHSAGAVASLVNELGEIVSTPWGEPERWPEFRVTTTKNPLPGAGFSSVGPIPSRRVTRLVTRWVLLRTS